MDAHGNTGSAQFRVTVRDTTPPALSLPPDATLTATDPAGATYTYTATAIDLVAGVVAATCEPASGSLFPVGTTTVLCAASDGINIASGSFTVTVLPPSATVNNAPIALSATYIVQAGTSLGGVLKGSDPDGDRLTFRRRIRGLNSDFPRCRQKGPI